MDFTFNSAAQDLYEVHRDVYAQFAGEVLPAWSFLLQAERVHWEGMAQAQFDRDRKTRSRERDTWQEMWAKEDYNEGHAAGVRFMRSKVLEAVGS